MSVTSTNSGTSPTAATEQVDVRGPRFAAWITTAILIAALVAAAFSTVAAIVLLAIQTAVFAVSATVGPRRSPYGRIFATFVAPRLSPVTDREPVAPLRFAQLVGFLFGAAGLVSFLAGVTTLGLVFTGFALFAALLNAAFGICLGCQIYPIVARFRSPAAAAAS